jgi:hypothetical protein
MNSYYRRMYVLSEEEYSRLKLMQKVPSSLATTTTTTADQEPQLSAPPPHQQKASASDVADQPASSKSKFSCSICAKIYKQKRDLRYHFKKAHAVIVTPPTEAVIPKAAVAAAAVQIIKKKNKNKKKKKIRIVAFDKVKKWMTIHV